MQRVALDPVAEAIPWTGVDGWRRPLNLRPVKPALPGSIEAIAVAPGCGYFLDVFILCLISASAMSVQGDVGAQG